MRFAIFFLPSIVDLAYQHAFTRLERRFTGLSLSIVLHESACAARYIQDVVSFISLHIGVVLPCGDGHDCGYDQEGL